MAATTTRRTATRKPPDIPSSDPPMDLLPPATVGAADVTTVMAALTRTVQGALAGIAAAVGRGDMSPNATLVRLGAHREDVEVLRAFLAAQPRPSHIPPED